MSSAIRDYAVPLGIAIAFFLLGWVAQRPAAREQFERCACQHCTCRCHIRHDELLPDGYDSWDEVPQ